MRCASSPRLSASMSAFVDELDGTESLSAAAAEEEATAVAEAADV